MGNTIGNTITQHELRKENECLRTELRAAQTKLAQRPPPPLPRSSNVPTAINPEALGRYIDALLADKATNIGFLPDFVERKIYANVFSILLRLIDDTLEKSEISFLGHRIVFDVVDGRRDDEVLTLQQPPLAGE